MRIRTIAAAATAVALATPIAANAHVNGHLHTHEGDGGGLSIGFGIYNGGFDGAPTPAQNIKEDCLSGAIVDPLCSAVMDVH